MKRFSVVKENMELLNELEFRVALAVDFLSQCIDSEGDFAFKFAEGKKRPVTCPWLHYLHAVSFLYSAADFLEKQRLKDQLGLTFVEKIEAATFGQDECLFVVKEDRSLTVWNALTAIIYMKLDEDEKALGFLNSLLESIGDYVSLERPLTTQVEMRPTNHGSRILVALLLGFDYFKDEKFLDAASFVAETLLNHALEYDQYEIWAMDRVDSDSPDARYSTRARKILAAIKDLSLDSMSSLFLATALQSFIAGMPFHGENRFPPFIQRQMALQVDSKTDFGWGEEMHGGFVSHERNTEIRLDYAVQSALAMYQYYLLLQRKDISVII